MTRILACVSLVFILPLPAAQAQAIYKCANPSGITYQQRPCTSDETIPDLAALSEDPTALRSTPSRVMSDCPKASAPKRVAWRNSSLCIGITDDEVLNLPGWGRPLAIDRWRDRRGWQERWTYAANPDGEALDLRFLNGKLASVEAR